MEYSGGVGLDPLKLGGSRTKDGIGAKLLRSTAKVSLLQSRKISWENGESRGYPII